MTRNLTQNDVEHLETMLDLVNRNIAVLTAAEIHPDIPTTADVGPGRRLNAPGPVRHMGFGLFEAGNFHFDGGGAMTRSETFSYTRLRSDGSPTPSDIGYKFDEVQRALRDLITQVEEA